MENQTPTTAANLSTNAPLPRWALAFVATALLLASIGFLGHHVWTVFAAPTIDDAAISYAYASNVAAGNGFRHTRGASPAEGFSNPLEVLLLVPFAALHVDVDIAAKAINLGFVLLALLAWGLFLIRRAEGVGCLFVPLLGLLPLLWPTFNYWTVAGLENGILAGLMALSTLCLLAAPGSRRWDYALALVAGLLAWTRPEAALYGALAVLPRLLSSKRRTLALGGFALMGTALFVFRQLTFRDVLPNTFWPKMGADHTWKDGWKYAEIFLRAKGREYFFCLVPLLALLSRKTRIPLLAPIGQVGAVLLFVVVSGGDWMRFGRFLQFLQGPAIAMVGLGLYAALVTGGWLARRIPVVARLVLLAGLSLPLIFVNRPIGEWKTRALEFAASRDVDMRRIATCAALYRDMGAAMSLGRPLLEADVDVGGMAYPLGMNVLDIAGLTDRVLGHAWSRQPTLLADYIFGERHPDTIHLHGSWLIVEPLDYLWPFHDQYRVMGSQLLSQLALAPVTAVRADLVDPAVPPVMPVTARVGEIEIKGISALLGHDETFFFVHALQVRPGVPPALAWKDDLGRTWPIAWHGEFDVESGPPGSALVGMARLQDAIFPLHLEDIVDLDSLPLFTPSATTLTDTARLPLLRLAGVKAPACDPDRLLDPSASPGARARGAVLLASLCGDALSHPDRAALAARFWDEGQRTPDPDERFDILTAISALGIGPSIRQRMFIEQARSEHQPYDEILMAWAERELASALLSRATIKPALALWLAAHQYDRVLLASLANGWLAAPATAPFACAASRALGLREGAMGWSVACARTAPEEIKVRRQGFENLKDQSLQLLGAAKNWIGPAAALRFLGGQGQQLLATRPDPGHPEAAGEVIWGPLPWPGRRFGALLAGAPSGATLSVEAKEGSDWKKLAQIDQPPVDTVLTPILLMLPAHSATDVRVRVVATDSQPTTVVDALTFVDLE
jgi:hypothetical protein